MKMKFYHYIFIFLCYILCSCTYLNDTVAYDSENYRNLKYKQEIQSFYFYIKENNNKDKNFYLNDNKWFKDFTLEEKSKGIDSAFILLEETDGQ